MSARKKGAPAPRPRSGFVTEEQRNTERLTLRLKPAAMAKLRGLAECTSEGGKAAYAKVVEAALDALERELDARDAERDEAARLRSTDR